MRLLAIACLVVAVGSAAAGEDTRPGTPSDMVEPGLLREETAQVVAELFAENRELRDELEGLREENARLERRLAEAMARLDVVKMPDERERRNKTTATAAFDPGARLTVLDVNRDMKVAVISGGLRAGMKVGMRFVVFRGDESIADLKLVDVRETIAGGLVERVADGRFPAAGDSLVLKDTQN